jgi:hypothetical protein
MASGACWALATVAAPRHIVAFLRLRAGRNIDGGRLPPPTGSNCSRSAERDRLAGAPGHVSELPMRRRLPSRLLRAARDSYALLWRRPMCRSGFSPCEARCAHPMSRTRQAPTRVQCHVDHRAMENPCTLSVILAALDIDQRFFFKVNDRSGGIFGRLPKFPLCRSGPRKRANHFDQRRDHGLRLVSLIGTRERKRSMQARTS